MLIIIFKYYVKPAKFLSPTLTSYLNFQFNMTTWMTTKFWKLNVSKTEHLIQFPISLLLLLPKFVNSKSTLLGPETLDSSLTPLFLSHSTFQPTTRSDPAHHLSTPLSSPWSPCSSLNTEHSATQICSSTPSGCHAPLPHTHVVRSLTFSTFLSNVTLSEKLSLMTLSYPITLHLLNLIYVSS